MSQPRNVKLSVEVGRGFMLADPPWFDINMCRSSHGLIVPEKGAPPTEFVKYTICRHAIDAYHARHGQMSLDDLLAYMWYTYAMAPCQYTFDDVIYVALVSLRGVCWVSRVPLDVFDVDGPHFAQLMTLTGNTRANLREFHRQSS